MKKFKVFAILVFLAAGVLLMAATAPAATSAAPKTTAPSTSQTAKATPQYGGTLRFIHSQGAQYLGWPPSQTGSDFTIASPALESIIKIDTQFNFVPTGLATGLRVSSDRKSYTLTLRKGVKFHDGTDFNAAAVKWNFDNMLGSGQMGTNYWASTDVIDDNTVRLNLKQPDFGTTVTLASQTGWMVSPTAAKANPKEWSYTHVVGTGPFKLTSFVRDSSAKYAKNTDYWQKGLPYLDGVEYYIISNTTTASATLQSGGADGMNNLADMPAILDLQQKGWNILTFPWSYYGLAADSANPNSILAKKDVRLALDYAINKKAIGDVVGRGFWAPLSQYADPGWGAAYVPGLPVRSYDPVKAKQLLVQAGYPNGFKTKIFCESGAVDQNALVGIQSDWKAIGVDVELVMNPRAQQVQLRSTGWSDGFVFSRTGVEKFFSRQLDFLDVAMTQYRSVARPPGWAAIMNSVAAASDYASYSAAIQKAATAMDNDMTMINLWRYSSTAPMSTKVHDTGLFGPTCFNNQQWDPAHTWMSK
jgi:peptide/nickel transport system substrate-binding protein